LPKRTAVAVEEEEEEEVVAAALASVCGQTPWTASAIEEEAV